MSHPTHHAILFRAVRPQRVEPFGQLLGLHGLFGHLQSPLELVQLRGVDARLAGQLEGPRDVEHLAQRLVHPAEGPLGRRARLVRLLPRLARQLAVLLQLPRGGRGSDISTEEGC